MPIIVLQHDPRCSPGRLGQTLRSSGKLLDVRRLDLPTEELGGPKGNKHIPIDFDNIEGVISMGGHMNVGEDYPWMSRELEFLKESHRRNLPLVGVCLGHQMIAKALGGEVGPMESAAGEEGMAPVKQHPVANTDIVLAGVPWRHMQFQSHKQEVKTLPPGATCLQYSDACKAQSFRAGLRTYAFQYHLECDMKMIETFLGVERAFDRGDERDAPKDPYLSEVLESCRTNYGEYARVSDRLCENMASFLFPVMRKIVA